MTTQMRDLDERYRMLNLETEANIVLGYSCNNNCLFCCEANNRQVRNKTAADIKNDMLLAKKMGVTRVVFTGGEPTVRKDIFELMELARELKFRERLVITNGRMFSYESFTKKMVDAGMTHTLFSLVGHTRTLHDFITQSPGSFEQILKGIANVQGYGMVVGNNTTIVKPNYRYLPNIMRLLARILYGPSCFSEYIFVNPCGNAETYFETMVPRVSEAAPYSHNAIDIGIKAGVKVMVESFPFCYMTNYEKYMTEFHMAEGRSKLTPEANLLDLNKSRKEHAKVKGQSCQKCRYFLVCEGLWVNYAKHYGFDELKPVHGTGIDSMAAYRASIGL